MNIHLTALHLSFYFSLHCLYYILNRDQYFESSPIATFTSCLTSFSTAKSTPSAHPGRLVSEGSPYIRLSSLSCSPGLHDLRLGHLEATADSQVGFWFLGVVVPLVLSDELNHLADTVDYKHTGNKFFFNYHYCVNLLKINIYIYFIYKIL